MPEFIFLFNILRMNGQNLTKFCIHIIIDKIYVSIVSRHFLPICNRVTPLIYFRIQFLFNILRMNHGQNSTKFCIHIIIDKIIVGVVNCHFRKFATELRPLNDVRIQFLFNILRTNRQNLTKFCIHIIIDKIYVWILNCHISQICNRVTALD